MRKIAFILFVILCLGAGAIFFATKKNPGAHHFPERRLWKDAAILAITNDLKDPDYLNALARSPGRGASFLPLWFRASQTLQWSREPKPHLQKLAM
jgi:hypothetical protein